MLKLELKHLYLVFTINFYAEIVVLPLKVRMQSLAFRHRRRGIDRGSLEIWARARYGARWSAYHWWQSNTKPLK